jgi:hypothetical protein
VNLIDKAQRVMEVKLHAFLISELDGRIVSPTVQQSSAPPTHCMVKRKI